jgi:ketosteroid isomerase-like protein
VEPGPPDRREAARNLAAIQRAWDAFHAKPITVDGIRRGDLKPVLAMFDRGIVWDATEVGVPGIGTYLGHRGVRQFWIDWFETIGHVHTNVLENSAAGDKVLSVCVQTGRGILSDATVMWEFAMVFTMRDAKVVRMDMYGDLDEARRVAGVAPATPASAET